MLREWEGIKRDNFLCTRHRCKQWYLYGQYKDFKSEFFVDKDKMLKE